MFTYMAECVVGWYSVHITLPCTHTVLAELHTLLSPIYATVFFLDHTDMSFRNVWYQGNKNVN